ncbi:glucose inhibited division protein [Rhodobacter ferrooxidans]|uniref:Glucose inhibited division protein n=1 Tax=Rhodobacter ferrooxidans TaxID=371731 RepID=C8S222_9RHOB|nr:glucose inhibited division protein [Rhodobacter sp. SW2]
MVLACIAAELQPQARFTLIEADQRKATFLRQAAQELNLKVQVLAQRIESTPPQAADVVSARALAPLDQLLSYAAWHLAPSGVGLFPKGTNFAAEVVDARKKWDFDIVVIPSKTEPAAAVLKVKDLKHV